MDGPDGKVGHAEVKIGDSILMLADEFPDMGARMGTFEDPLGHKWNVATHVEDVSPEDMEARAAEAMQNM